MTLTDRPERPARARRPEAVDETKHTGDTTDIIARVGDVLDPTGTHAIRREIAARARLAAEETTNRRLARRVRMARQRRRRTVALLLKYLATLGLCAGLALDTAGFMGLEPYRHITIMGSGLAVDLLIYAGALLVAAGAAWVDRPPAPSRGRHASA